MIGGLLRVLVIALVLLVGAMVWLNSASQRMRPPEVATVLSEPKPLPQLGLVDHRGGEFTRTSLEGQLSLMFFGFTHCPDVCPLTLQVLAQVRDELSARGLEVPPVVFVSVDPARDTPQRIASYLSNFDPGMIGVTGDQGALAPLVQALGVTVMTQSVPGQQSYTVTHNSTIYVIGPDTRLHAVFSAPHDAGAIATDVERIRRLVLDNTARAASS